MRQVGTIGTERDAQRFSDYLLTVGVPARVDATAGGHSIWVYEENDVDRARTALDEFNADPNQPRFAEAQRQAGKLRQAQQEKRRKAPSQVIQLRDRWKRPATGQAPLTMLLVAASIGITLLTDFGKRHDIDTWLWLSNVGPQLPEVRQGQWWRLLTPMFLHLSWMHLIFNMYWLYVLGSMIEIRRGTWTLAALVLTSQTVAALAQNYYDGPHFGGMSGVGYALFGYCWMKTHFDPAAGIFIDRQIIVLMIVWLLICATPAGEGVANTAHVAGLIVGALCGYAPTLLRR